MDDLTIKFMPVVIRRREGFPGQHHVVLPPSVVQQALRHPLLHGLMPTDAGAYPQAAGHYVERARGAAGTVLLVCTAGAGWVRWKEREQRVSAGGVVLLPPMEAHAYGADEDDPWTLEWAHFSGDEAVHWREAVLGRNQDSVCLKLPASFATALGLARVYERLETGYHEPELLAAAAALRWSLTELVRLRHLPGNTLTVIDALDATATWMREHLEQRMTLGKLAMRARLSVSHFSALFRQRFGYAPIDWLIRQRIQHACQLLDGTGEKVEVVGQAVGFADPYYFSRMFRRVMGVSPRKYRGTVKG
jgi:AraC family transcriptional regulator, arabinose operon regulatory protein